MIETLLMLAAFAVAGAVCVQVYRRRQDVLHGPYIRREWSS